MSSDGGQDRMREPIPADQSAIPNSAEQAALAPPSEPNIPSTSASPAMSPSLTSLPRSPPAPTPEVAVPKTAGSSVYGELIAVQLTDEQARKTSLEQRGLAVITTSGVLVSLLFALGAVAVKRAETIGLPLPTRLLLIAALTAFVAAAALGLATNLPRAYVALALADLRRMVTPGLWDKAEGPAARRVAENRVELVAVARRINATKARLLSWAVGAETVGVALVAAAVAVLLVQRS